MEMFLNRLSATMVVSYKLRLNKFRLTDLSYSNPGLDLDKLVHAFRSSSLNEQGRIWASCLHNCGKFCDYVEDGSINHCGDPVSACEIEVYG
jgi:hypothetical protein